MDKLDSYGDNFRSIPICVHNETDKDAQIFKDDMREGQPATWNVSKIRASQAGWFL